ncbi:TrbC family F-type conjugative pilus assembly protein [Escherichia coli]|nr:MULTISPECIES: TrbC family F-type conjugative pilus assembly protein [Gammaproteobacteria]MCU2329981.1 TrbC family F-type conjugative pilus assembly protein [Enterobacter hormaechei subsp. steigerwaltii]HAS0789572.1 hypothetical protein [Enterobacter hormaechei subsp. xiangfangensis]MDD1412690.1 conjugal transfer protein TraW [Escherichia coli]MDM8048182.1 TrbC family F-type conjugative pilus assembly protein [Escherichia coli]MDO2402230.1 TrbC family F-type conjugative pilus assembly protei
MHCFNRIMVCAIAALGICAASAQDTTTIFDNSEKANAIAEKLKKEGFGQTQQQPAGQDEKWLHANQKKVLQQAEALKQQMPGVAEGESNERVQYYQQAAEELSATSMAGMRNGLEKQVGLSKQESSLFGGDEFAVKEDVFAIFISFSMSDAEIKDALQAASRANAKVFLKGMKNGHTSITDTMKTIRQIASGMDNPPETRFNPKAFETFGVTQVPTIIYQDKGKVYLAKGIMNLGWLKAQVQNGVEVGDLGQKGPTKPVKERSIIETMQERLAKYDWEGQKKKTIQSFWSRQQFEQLPAARLNKIWFINPTVRVKADVVNPRGDVLARAGDVLNPLDIPTGQQNFLLFDATDTRQLEWATKEAAKKHTGPVVIMTSQISKEKGWDHLEALRQQFQQEIYLIPKELIKRFHIAALPVMITPDMTKKVFKVEQFEMELAN